MEKLYNEVIELIKDGKSSKEELTTHFSTTQISNVCAIKSIIKKLEEANFIGYDKENKLYYLTESNFFIGKITSNKIGSKFIRHEGKNYYFKEKLYLDNDIVKYSINDGKARVDEIISREEVNFVCEVTYKKGEIILNPFSEKRDFPFQVDIKELKYVADGDRILLDIDKKLTNNVYNAKFNRVICNSRDMNANMKTLCETYGFKTEFSEKALEEMKKIPNKVLESDLEGRKDQRKELFFTIDGKDTKDRDDAITVEKCSNGDYILRVNISHVSNYVKPGMALWDEALDRGNTVYTPGSSNPQLPQYITNGNCTLSEKVDRLTKTTEIRLDSKGKILKYKIYDSVINSRKAFNYDEVNEYFETGVIPQDAEKLTNTLDLCLELSNILTKNKLSQGYISINSDEIYFDLDSTGKVKNMKSSERGKAQDIIENFMVMANHVYNEGVEKNNLSAIYRNHGEPDYKKIAATINRIKKMKIIDVEEIKKAANIQELLQYIPEDINGYIASRLILRSLRKAYYDTINLGHYGLALNMYAQSTSPIRRGNDLVDQYLQDLYAKGELFNKDILEKELNIYARRFSERERAAEKIEVIADSLKALEYYKANEIDDIKVTVVDINNEFLSVKTMGSPEGIVYFDEDMINFYYDKNADIIRERGSNRTIRVGSKLSVTPLYVSELGIVYKYASKIRKKEHTRTRNKASLY